eukprot:CAMPEP_0184555340 /NCGR_PEP_ID=MMETSP0199_2-20130426/37311_1 /TAXON_ID=1112570 /ORGANISM="Thraustochytrium sp., Strain LLF1b" /LENGTH=77 /DNA_ID=CAMNT_0026951633 /DNA_START=213 /DNA_END=443 /DNA_ORIENTATION=-
MQHLDREGLAVGSAGAPIALAGGPGAHDLLQHVLFLEPSWRASALRQAAVRRWRFLHQAPPLLSGGAGAAQRFARRR